MSDEPAPSLTLKSYPIATQRPSLMISRHCGKRPSLPSNAGPSWSMSLSISHQRICISEPILTCC